jgi:transposase-like protein
MPLMNEYWVCPGCGRRFLKQYSPKRTQLKVYGTKTLLSLWAYYNWQRHLKRCCPSAIK